jgi:flagellar biogenesis protein FliO
LRSYPPLPENVMEALKLLLTTDIGLLSLGAILFMIVMAIYLFTRFRKLMNQEPGKEGWK